MEKNCGDAGMSHGERKRDHLGVGGAGGLFKKYLFCMLTPRLRSVLPLAGRKYLKEATLCIKSHPNVEKSASVV